MISFGPKKPAPLAFVRALFGPRTRPGALRAVDSLAAGPRRGMATQRGPGEYMYPLLRCEDVESLYSPGEAPVGCRLNRQSNRPGLRAEQRGGVADKINQIDREGRRPGLIKPLRRSPGHGSRRKALRAKEQRARQHCLPCSSAAYNLFTHRPSELLAQSYRVACAVVMIAL